METKTRPKRTFTVSEENERTTIQSKMHTVFYKSFAKYHDGSPQEIVQMIDRMFTKRPEQAIKMFSFKHPEMAKRIMEIGGIK